MPRPWPLARSAARFALGLAMAGVFLFLTTSLLVAFLGWWALVVPLAWVGVAARYRFRPVKPTLEAKLFAVGLARTNDV